MQFYTIPNQKIPWQRNLEFSHLYHKTQTKPIVGLRITNKVFKLFLNSGHRYNMLTPGFIKHIQQYLDHITRSAEPEAVVLTTSDPLSFSRGTDFKTLSKYLDKGDIQGCIKYFNDLYQLSHRTAGFNKPLLIELKGEVCNSAIQVFSSLPFVFSDGTASFKFNDIDFNSIPTGGLSFSLSRLESDLGTYLALTGEKLSGQDLKRYKFIYDFYKLDSQNLEKMGKAYQGHFFDDYEFQYAPLYEHKLNKNEDVNKAIKEFFDRLYLEPEKGKAILFDLFYRKKIIEAAERGVRNDLQNPLNWLFLTSAKNTVENNLLSFERYVLSNLDSSNDIQVPSSLIFNHANTIARIFSKSSIKEIKEALIAEGSPFCLRTLEKLNIKSEFILELTLKMLKQAVNKDFNDCLLLEANILLNLLDQKQLRPFLFRSEKKGPNLSEIELNNIIQIENIQLKQFKDFLPKSQLLPARNYFRIMPEALRCYLNGQTIRDPKLHDNFNQVVKYSLIRLGIDYANPSFSRNEIRHGLRKLSDWEFKLEKKKERVVELICDPKAKHEYYYNRRNVILNLVDSQTFWKKLQKMVSEVFEERINEKINFMSDKSRCLVEAEREALVVKIKTFLIKFRLTLQPEGSVDRLYYLFEDFPEIRKELENQKVQYPLDISNSINDKTSFIERIQKEYFKPKQPITDTLHKQKIIGEIIIPEKRVPLRFALLQDYTYQNMKPEKLKNAQWLAYTLKYNRPKNETEFRKKLPKIFLDEIKERHPNMKFDEQELLKEIEQQTLPKYEDYSSMNTYQLLKRLEFEQWKEDPTDPYYQEKYKEYSSTASKQQTKPDLQQMPDIINLENVWNIGEAKNQIHIQNSHQLGQFISESGLFAEKNSKIFKLLLQNNSKFMVKQILEDLWNSYQLVNQNKQNKEKSFYNKKQTDLKFSQYLKEEGTRTQLENILPDLLYLFSKNSIKKIEQLFEDLKELSGVERGFLLKTIGFEKESESEALNILDEIAFGLFELYQENKSKAGTLKESQQLKLLRELLILNSKFFELEQKQLDQISKILTQTDFQQVLKQQQNLKIKLNEKKKQTPDIKQDEEEELKLKPKYEDKPKLKPRPDNRLLEIALQDLQQFKNNPSYYSAEWIELNPDLQEEPKFIPEITGVQFREEKITKQQARILYSENIDEDDDEDNDPGLVHVQTEITDLVTQKDENIIANNPKGTIDFEIAELSDHEDLEFEMMEPKSVNQKKTDEREGDKIVKGNKQVEDHFKYELENPSHPKLEDGEDYDPQNKADKILSEVLSETGDYYNTQYAQSVLLNKIKGNQKLEGNIHPELESRFQNRLIGLLYANEMLQIKNDDIAENQVQTKQDPNLKGTQKIQAEIKNVEQQQKQIEKENKDKINFEDIKIEDDNFGRVVYESEQQDLKKQEIDNNFWLGIFEKMDNIPIHKKMDEEIQFKMKGQEQFDEKIDFTDSSNIENITFNDLYLFDHENYSPERIQKMNRQERDKLFDNMKIFKSEKEKVYESLINILSRGGDEDIPDFENEKLESDELTNNEGDFADVEEQQHIKIRYSLERSELIKSQIGTNVNEIETKALIKYLIQREVSPLNEPESIFFIQQYLNQLKGLPDGQQLKKRKAIRLHQLLKKKIEDIEQSDNKFSLFLEEYAKNKIEIENGGAYQNQKSQDSKGIDPADFLSKIYQESQKIEIENQKPKGNIPKLLEERIKLNQKQEQNQPNFALYGLGNKNDVEGIPGLIDENLYLQNMTIKQKLIPGVFTYFVQLDKRARAFTQGGFSGFDQFYYRISDNDVRIPNAFYELDQRGNPVDWVEFQAHLFIRSLFMIREKLERAMDSDELVILDQRISELLKPGVIKEMLEQKLDYEMLNLQKIEDNKLEDERSQQDQLKQFDFDYSAMNFKTRVKNEKALKKYMAFEDYYKHSKDSDADLRYDHLLTMYEEIFKKPIDGIQFTKII